MRKKLGVVFAFLAGSLLMGMGDLGGLPEGSIPEPEKNFQVRLVDRSGTVTDLERFSMDGKIFFEGEKGRANMTIPFHTLKLVSFGQTGSDRVVADLVMRTGDQLELNVKKRLTFYGSTGYGTFRIRAQDIQRIEFP